MKPQTALKLQYSLLDKYTREQIETIRDEWIAAYREIAEGDSSKKELCDYFIDRISRAAELFMQKKPALPTAIIFQEFFQIFSKTHL